jgi:predicted RNA-binding Zn-ribbon protein involved in translation (DUF1610 family)
MASEPLFLELHCRACSSSEVLSEGRMAARLRELRKLRARSNPGPEIVAELFKAAAAEMTCPACGATGLVAAPPAEEQFDWPEPRRCEACDGTIEPERLELLPDTALCAACQRQLEQGTTPGATEYCPRCGAPMVLRLSRGGVARYRMACTSDPPCRL